MATRFRAATFVLVVAAITVAGALFAHDSPDGQGIAFDSAHYLSAAENLQQGRGLDVSFTSGFDPLPTPTALAEYGDVPLTHFPPGYPLALALVDPVVPGELQGAARAIGLAAIALTVICAFGILRTMQVHAVVAALGALLIGITPALQRLAMWVLSDAIAAALALAAIAVACLRDRRAPARVVELAAGLVAAASVLVRFGGVGGALAAFVLCVDWRSAWRSRAAVAARTVLPSVVVVVGLFAINALRGAGEARPVAWHPPGTYEATLLSATTGMWTIGNRTNGVLYAASAVLAVVVVVAAWSLHAQNRSRTVADGAVAPAASPARVGVALGVFALAQVLVLLVTSTFLDSDVGFDRRLMLPAELAVGIVVLGAFAVRPPALAGAAVLLVLLVARLQVETGPFPQGTAVPHPPSYDSIFDAVAAYPEDTVIATSVPEVVWGTTGRASIFSPAEYDTLSGRRAQDVDGELRELGRLVGARGGILLLQKVESPRLTRPSDVARVLPCALVAHQNDNAIVYDLTPCAG